MKKLIIIPVIIFTVVTALSAVENSKPDTHNTSWTVQHGQASKINEKECLSCHVERLACIACHEDVPPRNHSIAWVQKNHGLESRWNRTDCKTCHKQDFCSDCHETSVPLNHIRAGFGEPNSSGFHCQTSCQLPSGNWKNTVAKNCIVCHKTRPTLKNGLSHSLR